jgi:hypothetical protein
VTVTETAEAAAPSVLTETATVTVSASPDVTTPPESETAGADDTQAAGGSVTEGTLEYELLDVEFPDSVDSFGQREEADGQFVVVTLNVSNSSDAAVDYPGWEQQLIDDQGRTHDTSEAGLFLEDSFSYDTINPGLSEEGVLAFDIPADSEATALLLHSGIFDDDYVELPLAD